MNAKLKKAKDGSVEALAVMGGLVAAKLAADFMPAQVPAKMKGLPLILLGLAPHVFDMGGSIGKNVGNGIAAAGLIETAQQFTAGKTGILGTVNKALPQLSGFNGFNGLGAFEDVTDNVLYGMEELPVYSEIDAVLG